ncbi:vWA domain-containing protein [Aestuariispira insulae]|uniref:von Willebrand factor type A domain-containing protein n=1 Tax=Aestuariispira insulae TaxID=1461337 RepID=A0A3D9H7C4_9PROT|nr:vWA domain-containing protein [Aestuariispira insulae]RED44856.1 hypothetical protein DFP90_11361 [Aestuariispira insulae]
MKRSRRAFEIFNMSFLDVISCGFGAVVLLVLISKYQIAPEQGPNEEIAPLLSQVLELENRNKSLSEELQQLQQTLASASREAEALSEKAEIQAQKRETERKQGAKLQQDLEGLQLVQESLKRATITPGRASERDEEVGGIPVDSDYVIFIVDTSGSMKEIWGRVTKEVVNVIKIHPEIKGFQIMNDNGLHMISGYAGKWIPDTPARRKSVMNLFKGWNSSSNSSPVEGIEVALKKYARPDINLSIYVFGDDFTGSSYDRVVKEIDQLNKRKPDGTRLAKIHGVAFLSKHSTNRFPTLMREVTKRNGGTFLGLTL